MPHRIIGYPGTSSGGSGASGDGAADFDGTNDYGTCGSTISSVASKYFSFVTWFRIDGLAATSIILSARTGGGSPENRFNVGFINDYILVRGYDSSNQNVFAVTSTSTFSTSATWKCMMVSGDVQNNRATLYVGDTDMTDFTTRLNFNIDFSVTSWALGALPSGIGKFDGCLSRTWLKVGTYLDFSQESVRRKFYSATGTPVYLGTDGSVPTGSVPNCYHFITDAVSADNYALNLGSGADFTVTGALVQASTVP